jgi:hypothetical protein
MRRLLLAAVIAASLGATLSGTASGHSRGCGSFVATSFTGARTHVGVTVYSGPVRCCEARRVLRYSITHKERRGNVAVGSPDGWNCANGGPGLGPAAAGYSCEASNPARLVTGRFLH